MNSKIKRRIYYCLLFSLLVHLVFLVWSLFVKLVPTFRSLEKPQRLMHVKIAQQETLGRQSPNIERPAAEKTAQPENPFVDVKTVQPSVKSKDMVKNSMSSSIPREKFQPRQISAHHQEALKRPQLTDKEVTKKVRRAIRKNLVEMGEVPTEDFASGAPVLTGGRDISKEFLDKNNPAMRVGHFAVSPALNRQDSFQVMRRASSGIGRKGKAADLGANLTYELYKYQDPKTQKKYFKLLVKVRDATVNFSVVPKEVVYLLDASASIGAGRFKQMEQGLVASLARLNPEDRFNIIVFKNKTIPLSDTSLPPDSKNLKRAAEFLGQFKSGSTTDVYAVLQGSLNLDNALSPSYRILMSDGYPTRGILNARQVINDISKVNDRKVSFFTFSGGQGVSRYMLDFIAYKNRGWSEYVDREYQIGKELIKFNDKIRDPLLLNLRYQIGGVDDREVFPQIMPDFFKGSEFVIFGAFDEDKKFHLRVLGNTLAEVKEFVVTDTLQNAVKGDKTIAWQWAFHKVYHLIGQLRHDENNEAALQAIHALCNEFDIVTPYSQSLVPTRKGGLTPAAKKK